MLCALFFVSSGVYCGSDSQVSITIYNDYTPIDNAVMTITDSSGNSYQFDWYTKGHNSAGYKCLYCVHLDDNALIPDGSYKLECTVDDEYYFTENITISSSSCYYRDIYLPDDFVPVEDLKPDVPEDTSSSVVEEDTSTSSSEESTSSSSGGDIFPVGTNNVLNNIHTDLLIIIVILSVVFGTRCIVTICKNMGGE